MRECPIIEAQRTKAGSWTYEDDQYIWNRWGKVKVRELAAHLHRSPKATQQRYYRLQQADKETREMSWKSQNAPEENASLPYIQQVNGSSATVAPEEPGELGIERLGYDASDPEEALIVAAARLRLSLHRLIRPLPDAQRQETIQWLMDQYLKKG